jgi:hypothetical protein
MFLVNAAMAPGWSPLGENSERSTKGASRGWQSGRRSERGSGEDEDDTLSCS